MQANDIKCIFEYGEEKQVLYWDLVAFIFN